MKTTRLTLLLVTVLTWANARAATFTVINTNDTGAGSFRAAISNANAVAGSHVIDFAIPGAGVQTINPATALPSLTKSVTIDGYTQPGASANTLVNDDDAVLLIELNGTGTGGNGLNLAVTNCVIRGLVINRFAGNGISTDNSRDNVIEGNFIGTDPTGTIKRPNAQGLLIGGYNTLVGGTTPAARNLISGNTGQGLSTSGTATTNVMVRGNFIGTDVHGTALLGNGGNGVSAASSTKTTIGGTAPGAGNVISGNGGNGISIVTSNNVVQGNFIGTDLTGTLNLSNHLDGVTLNSARNNTIGGAVGNVIAFNTGAGISISATVPNNTNNLISANTIFSNGAVGINLIANSDPVNGVSSNDVTDADTGANNLQNFPVLTSATNIASGLQIQGFLNSAPSTTFTLEFFANPTCDPSGFGEGEEFISSTNVTTAANGTNSFTVVFTNSVADGLFLTATATSLDNDTSEFSACRQIAAAAPTVVACSLLPELETNNVSTAHHVVATITSNSLPASGVLVNFSVTAGPNLGQAGTATTSVSGQGTFTYTGSATPGTDSIRAISTLAGNSSTCTATKVWLAVNQPPVAACQSVTSNANTSCQVTLVAANFDGGSFDNDGSITTRVISPTGPFTKGIQQVVLTVTDNNGASAVCTTTVTVVDNTGPSITCHSTIITNVAAGVTNAVVTFAEPTVADNCAGVSTNTVPASGSTFALGTNIVTSTAFDAAGLTNSCTFMVIVQLTPPTNILPIAVCQNVTVNADTNCLQAVSALAVDGGSSDPDGSIANRFLTPAGPYAKGTNSVTLTVVDNSGGSNSCGASIIVVDITPPVITCPADITVATSASSCSSNVSFTVTATDNCSGVTVVSVPASGSAFAKGTNIVVSTATDASGNTNSCSFNIIVVDTRPPTFVCSGTITTNVTAGVTNAIINYTVTVSDNCGVVSTNIVPASGTIFPLGTNPVVAIATDLSGNTSTCSFNVVVSDLPPVPHNLAITKLKVSKSINLKGGTPVTKSASVSIVNLSEHAETITTYSNLVSLVGTSLSNICPNATVVLHAGKPNKDLPLTLAPNKKLTVRFDVTYDCANDAAKGTGHEDFRFTATVNHAAIDGNADTTPANDICPRAPSDADKGCNKGLDAFTDVSIKTSNNQ